MKTTQVEFLKSLSSSETVEKHLVATRKTLVARQLSGDMRPSDTFIAIREHMKHSEEALSYLTAAALISLRVIALYKDSADSDSVVRGLTALFMGAYADGFEYAASLIDSSAESAVN